MAPGSAGGLTLLLMMLLLLLLVVAGAHGCRLTVTSKGTLPDTELAVPETTVDSSCACCGLCSSLANCSSMSFSTASGSCRMYQRVPNHTTLTRDETTDLYVIPGRSGHLEFCRDDADCQQAGDGCFGRICTTSRTVTCRYLADNGAPPDGIFDGAIDGELMKFMCLSYGGIAGWTMIGHFKAASGWTRENIVERNPDDPSSDNYSILQRAEAIRTAGTGDRYSILITAQQSGEANVGFRANVPTSQTLVSTTDTAGGDFVIDETFGDYGAVAGQLRVPWIQPSGSAILTIKGYQPSYIFGTLMSANKPHMDYTGYAGTSEVKYFIRE